MHACTESMYGVHELYIVENAGPHGDPSTVRVASILYFNTLCGPVGIWNCLIKS